MLLEGTPIIDIQYTAVENSNKLKGGWAPMVWNNKRVVGSDWHYRGLDQEVALKEAQLLAVEEANHYSGDWDITISEKA